MTGQQKTKYALDGEIIKIRRGLAIYKTGASRFFFARIRDTRNNKNIVRSTKETSKIEARKAAEGLFESLYVDGVISLVPREYRFETFADELRAQARNDSELGSRRDSHIKDIERLMTKIARKKPSPLDLILLATSLERLPKIITALFDFQKTH